MEIDIKSLNTRLFVVLGHYGSGKTEFAVNLALALADAGYRVCVADLDIVNPYFRSREREELFLSRGIDLIGSPPGCSDADVPAVSARVNMLFEDETLRGVIDAGGDPAGAKVLKRFSPRIKASGAEVCSVLNFRRPQTRSAEDAVRYLRDIERACGLKVTGLVDNTHLCGETEIEDILSGAEETERVSALSGIPVICHLVSKRLVGLVGDRVSPIFPIDIYMRKPWEV